MFIHASSVLLFGLLCLSAATRQYRVTSVVTFPAAVKIDDYKDMISAGVERIVIGLAAVRPDGTLDFKRVNKALMDEVHGITKDTDVELFVRLSPIIKEDSAQKFQKVLTNQLKKYFDEFHLDGALVHPQVLSSSTSVVAEGLRYIGDTVRGIKSWRGRRGRVGLMFNTAERSWSLIAPTKPVDHYDFAVCLLNIVSPIEISNTKQFAVDVLHRWNNITSFSRMLEFGVMPLGRKVGEDSIFYRSLIYDGAPVTGDGKFNGYFYDSQTQINEKAEIVINSQMRGISFIGAEFDLHATDKRSLVAAALAKFPAL
ncbi:hypothetical protein FOL47_007790 [Perkinsus chesapeaki]|uniref:Chitinase n=1 Tax=Perkinsus chesapeaki TaxID=330153 RepID=A0A7J6LIF0_PERCH|nr:hypothetical protein FOL47_007790 [Perkinsus chesapeaki]